MSDTEVDSSGETPETTTPPPSAPEPVATPSFSVGATLREGRERLGQDLAQVATTLRIRQPFLVALEEGRFKDLPGGTYAIGFLRTYAEFLGLDGEEMVRRFRQEAADALTVHAELQFPSPVSEGRMPSASVLLTGLAVAVVAYGLWWGVTSNRDSGAELIPAVPDRLTNLLKRPAGMGTVAAPSAEAPAPDAAANPVAADGPVPPVPGGASGDMTAAPVQEMKPLADVVPPSEDDGAKTTRPAPVAPAGVAQPVPVPVSVPTVPAAAKPAAPAAHQAAVPPVPAAASASAHPAAVVPPSVPADDGAASAGGHVVVKATDDSWIQVRESDGQLVVSRLLHQGDTYVVPDRSGLTLTTGNAGTLHILVDGKAVPSLGSSKQVKHDISLDPAKLMKRIKPETSAETPEAPAAAPVPAPEHDKAAAKSSDHKDHKDHKDAAEHKDHPKKPAAEKGPSASASDAAPPSAAPPAATAAPAPTPAPAPAPAAPTPPVPAPSAQ